jgi:hypothetical protein
MCGGGGIHETHDGSSSSDTSDAQVPLRLHCASRRIAYQEPLARKYLLSSPHSFSFSFFCAHTCLPAAVLPDRPTFGHLLIVNKTSLSLTLSLALTRAARSLWQRDFPPRINPASPGAHVPRPYSLGPTRFSRPLVTFAVSITSPTSTFWRRSLPRTT